MDQTIIRPVLQELDMQGPVVVVLVRVCVVTGYFVSNHAQTMKMFGGGSIWDM